MQQGVTSSRRFRRVLLSLLQQSFDIGPQLTTGMALLGRQLLQG
jgi:hypothetical protein